MAVPSRGCPYGTRTKLSLSNVDSIPAASFLLDTFVLLYIERMGFTQLEQSCILSTYNVKLVGRPVQGGHDVGNDFPSPTRT